jgi:hypothetical protein
MDHEDLFLHSQPSAVSSSFVRFRNMTVSYSETHNFEDHPLSALRDYLFNIFAATLHNWRPSPPPDIQGRAVQWS